MNTLDSLTGNEFAVMLGGLGGMVAGVIWTLLMLAKAKDGMQRGMLVGYDALRGAGIAWLVSIPTLAALTAGDRWAAPDSFFGIVIILILCTIVAIPAGAIVGALCGLIVPKRKCR